MAPASRLPAWNLRRDGRVLPQGMWRFVMRVLIGIILGVVLTVGAAYIYDSHNALSASTAPATVQRPMVNWDVVSTKWQHLTNRARSEWTRLAG
jgi:hypothetical protein